MKDEYERYGGDRDDWREIDRTGARIGVRLVVIIVAVILLIVAIWALTVAWAPWKGAGDQRKATQGNAQYRIAAYDEFFNACEAIAAKERIIERYREQLETATSPDEKSRLNAAITAESNVRDEMIADYNADAAKADTRGDFRADGLPYQIDPNGTTTCTG